VEEGIMEVEGNVFVVGGGIGLDSSVS